MKICTKCKQPKAKSAFYRDSRTLDGRYSACKVCARAATAKWRSNHTSEIIEYAKGYRREHSRELAARTRRWRAVNKPQLRKYWAKWNPVCNARRRAIKLAATCACCDPKEFTAFYAEGRRQGMHVDHIQPLSKGGPHCLKNLQFLTKTENQRKGAKWAA